MRWDYPWGKGFQYLFSYGANLGASILVLPLILRNYDLGIWNSVAIGSSLGALAAILIEGGWNFNGPGLHQKYRSDASHLLLKNSLRHRFYTCLVVVSILLPACWILSSQYSPLFSCMVALAFATTGFNLNWIYIRGGEGQKVLLFDAVPRIVSTLLIWISLICHLSIFIYPVIMLITNLISPTLTFRSHREFSQQHKIAEIQELKIFSLSFRMNVVIGIYNSSLIPLTSILVPLELSAYSLLDRIQKTIFGFASSFLAPLQFWIFNSSGEPHKFRRVNRLAMLTATINASLFYLTIPKITSWAFPKIDDIPDLWWIFASMNFAIVLMNRIYTFSYLIPLGEIKNVYKAIKYSGIIFALIVVLLPAFGVTAALFGLLSQQIYLMSSFYQQISKLKI